MALSVSVPVTVTRERFDTDVDERIGDDDEIGAGWFCIRTDPFPCPADGCDFVAFFMTAAHRIIVWPSADDTMLLRHAHSARQVGRSPHVVEYERAFGPCIAFDRWRQLGQPIHGRRDRPDGWPERPGW